MVAVNLLVGCVSWCGRVGAFGSIVLSAIFVVRVKMKMDKG